MDDRATPRLIPLENFFEKRLDKIIANGSEFSTAIAFGLQTMDEGISTGIAIMGSVVRVNCKSCQPEYSISGTQGPRCSDTAHCRGAGMVAEDAADTLPMIIMMMNAKKSMSGRRWFAQQYARQRCDAK